MKRSILLISSERAICNEITSAFESSYAEIWEDRFVKDESNIMSHIGRLRKKLGQEVGAYIETVWGIGYRFVNNEDKTGGMLNET